MCDPCAENGVFPVHAYRGEPGIACEHGLFARGPRGGSRARLAHRSDGTAPQYHGRSDRPGSETRAIGLIGRLVAWAVGWPLGTRFRSGVGPRARGLASGPMWGRRSISPPAEPCPERNAALRTNQIRERNPRPSSARRGRSPSGGCRDSRPPRREPGGPVVPLAGTSPKSKTAHRTNQIWVCRSPRFCRRSRLSDKALRRTVWSRARRPAVAHVETCPLRKAARRTKQIAASRQRSPGAGSKDGLRLPSTRAGLGWRRPRRFSKPTPTSEPPRPRLPRRRP